MLQLFVPLLFKKARRSTIWQKNLAINIIIGFFMFILIAEFLLLGILLDKILLEGFPDEAPEIIVEQSLIYYFLLTFLLRFYLQSLPSVDIHQFLHLPVSRKKIADFMHLRSLSSFFNFIPFIILLPFALKYMGSEYGMLSGILWFAAIFFFDMTSNFLLLFVKRKSTNNAKIFLYFIAFFAVIFGAEYFLNFSLGTITERYFEHLILQPLLIVLPIITLIAAFMLSRNYMIKNSYLEHLPGKNEKHETLSERFSGLNRYGKIGGLILNEIRLLLRNKRPKTVLFMMPLFLLYGFFFYPQETYRDSAGWLVFVGIFVTGGFLMAYGQYILGWESRHFDFIQSSNISRLDFFTAKYYLIAIPTIASYLITLPYIFFGDKILLINTMAALYNIGINGPTLLFTASFNRKRMELEKGSAMNYQGVGINNFLVIIPLMAVPAIGFNLTAWIFDTQIALIAFSAISVLGIIFHKVLIKSAVRFFEKNRYKISEGFRKQ